MSFCVELLLNRLTIRIFRLYFVMIEIFKLLEFFLIKMNNVYAFKIKCK